MKPPGPSITFWPPPRNGSWKGQTIQPHPWSFVALLFEPSAFHATLEVAAVLGVSDSLVSDYRRRIEQELRALSFSEVEEARRFEGALRDRVRELVLFGEQSEGSSLDIPWVLRKSLLFRLQVEAAAQLSVAASFDFRATQLDQLPADSFLQKQVRIAVTMLGGNAVARPGDTSVLARD